MKRGQITLFIIIALVLVASVVLLFKFKDDIIQQASKVEITRELTMTQEVRKVQSNLKDCTKGIAELGLIVMGLQGGYTQLSHEIKYTNTQTSMEYIPYFGTAFFYYKGQNLVPTKEIMQKQLENFITSNFITCEKQYPGLEIDYGKINTSVKIENEKIILNINSNIKVRKEKIESGFNNIMIELPIRLGIIQNISNNIVQEQIKISKEDICVSCISRIAAKNNILVDIKKINEDVFYTLTDNNSKIGDYDYIFMFANKF